MIENANVLTANNLTVQENNDKYKGNYLFDETLFLEQILNDLGPKKEGKTTASEQENIIQVREGISQFQLERDREKQFLQQKKQIQKLDWAKNKATFWGSNENCKNTMLSLKDNNQTDHTLRDRNPRRSYTFGYSSDSSGEG